MKQATFDKISKAWFGLNGKHKDVNGFSSFDELRDSIQGEVTGRYPCKLTRLTDTEPFHKDNVTLVDIEDDFSMEDIYYPSF